MTDSRHAPPGWITSVYAGGEDEQLQAERGRVRVNFWAMREYQAACDHLGTVPQYNAGQTLDDLYAELSACGLYRNGRIKRT